MRFEFDPEKDRINRAKHGVGLAIVAEMDFSQAIVVQDRRFDYGEDRFQALAPIGGRLHLVAYTMRGAVIRLISLRKANLRERKRFAGS